MSGIATAIVGGAVIGGIASNSAAGKAADAQTQAADQADATQRYMYDQTRADQQPFRDAGYNALAQLSAGTQPGGQFSRQFTTADMNADPVYQSGLQFGLNEGEKGINHQAAATGSLLSGATLKALTRYGNDYATTKGNDSYNRFMNNENTGFNRLASLAGVGQTANNTVASAGQNMANNVSANQIGAGNARASGYIGQGNALAGSLSNAYNGYQQNRLYSSIIDRNNQNAFWGGGGTYDAASSQGGFYPYGGSSFDAGNMS